MKYVKNPNLESKKVSLISLERKGKRGDRKQRALASIALSTGIWLERQNDYLLNDAVRNQLERAEQTAEKLVRRPTEKDNGDEIAPQHVFDFFETNLIQSGLNYLADHSNLEIVRTAKEKGLESALTRISLYIAALSERDELNTQKFDDFL